jgi:hypothetical protein
MIGRIHGNLEVVPGRGVTMSLDASHSIIHKALHSSSSLAAQTASLWKSSSIRPRDMPIPVQSSFTTNAIAWKCLSHGYSPELYHK